MIAARQIAFGKAAGKKEEPPAYWWLCFTAEEAGSTVAMQAVGSAPAVTLETSFDGEIWESFTVGETTITLPNVGDKVYFRAGEGGNTAMASSANDYNNFSIITGRIAASGNIMSLLNGVSPDSIIATYCYYSMFNGCTALVQAPELPATTLGTYCYCYMFNGCTSLVQAPELPATTLGTYCYYSMFNGCTSLVQAPELPATTLRIYCYYYMFNGSTSLVQAPELPATTLATFCYSNMFKGCTSLAQAPELPATTLKRSCYANMFRDCINIDCIKCSFKAFATGVTSNWLSGVSFAGTFICPTALGTNETIRRGVSYCPERWTVINKD